MKNLVIFCVIAILFSSCVVVTKPKRGIRNCSNPRPTICPMVYNPVCGKPINKTFSNGCVACMNQEVEYYIPGKCK